VKAEAHFERALSVARQQQAKSWELRAAMSLARLWRDQGKVQQAHELLGVAGRVGGVTVHCSSRVEHERRNRRTAF
jgi:predicted ATPase